MNSLPWYVVHGAAAWVLAAFASAALVALGAWAAPRLRARWRAARARRAIARGAPREVRWVDGAAVTLTGTLALPPGTAALAGFDRDGCALATARSRDGATSVSVAAGPLAIVVGEHTVALDGAPELAAGAVESWPPRPFAALPEPARARLAAADPDGELARARRVAVRAARAGDRVRVAGVLHADATGGEGAVVNYRGVVGARWRIAPARVTRVGDERASEAPAAPRANALPLATAGAPRVRGPGARRALAAALLGALGFALASAGAAEWALMVARRQLTTTHPSSRADLPEPDLAVRAAGLAAVVPGLRARALDTLAEALEVRAQFEQRSGERAADVHVLRGDPVAGARLLVAHGAFARGVVLAREAAAHPRARGGSLEAQQLAGEALYAQGEFGAASDALTAAHLPGAGVSVRPGFEARVHAAAGQWARAAAAAHAASRTVITAPTPRAPGSAVYECVALALEAREGDGAALGRLRAAAEQPSIERNYTAICRVLLADVLAGDARREVLERGMPAHDDEAYRWLYAMWWALGLETRNPLVRGSARVAEVEPADVLLSADRVGRVLSPALADAAYRAATASSERFQLATLLAAFASATGASEQGRRWAAAAITEIASDAPCPAPGVLRIVQIFDGDEDDYGGAATREGAVRELARVAWDRAQSLVEAGALPRSPETSDFDRDFADAMLMGEYRTDVEALVRLRAGIFDAGLQHALSLRGLLDAQTEPGWRLAADGDGAALAQWLTLHGARADALLRLAAPHVRAGREPLREWVRWTDPSRCVVCPVAHQAEDASARAAVLAALGAPREQIAPLLAAASRLRAAALRRDIAVPLTVLEWLDAGAPASDGVPISDVDLTSAE